MIELCYLPSKCFQIDFISHLHNGQWLAHEVFLYPEFTALVDQPRGHILVAQTFKELQFKLSVSHLIMRLEDLIEQDFICVVYLHLIAKV